MSVLTSSLNTANRAMSPITTYPQSGGVALEQSNNFRSKRTASPQRVPNGFSPGKSSSILSPRKTSKRFFRRPTQDKNQAVDVQPQGNEKKKPRVEIIYRDPPSESESDKETVVASLKKAFEVDGTSNLRSSSTLSGEWSPSTISEESAPTAPQTQCLDLNMNRVSSGSNISHTDRVVQEIVYTEQAYVKHLQEIIEGYLMNMRKENSPFDEQDVKDLFMNIEEIYEFNKEFLAELEECDEDPVEMAIKFASKEEGFATYTDYCTNYPLSMEVLTKCTQRQETAEFIKNIQVGLGHALPLGSYLLKPVQRILKYHLLLEDIQKHFDKESDTEGYDMVSDALSAMTSVAQHINEMKRQHEVAVHVQEIQSQMSDFEGPDLTTYGSLVLEDSFRVHGTRSDRYLFLFEQILLITKRKENGYSCKATLMLSNMMMVPKEPLAFQIIRFDNQKVNYTFLARNADQKRRWSLELKRLIVDSLAASVPISTKDKARILGEKSKEEGRVGEPLECEGKKRSGSLDGKLNRGMLPREESSSRVLVTVTADYVDVKPQRASYNINSNTSNQYTELELERLSRVSYKLANRNACRRLYQSFGKQYKMPQLVIDRRLSDPFQGYLKNRMILNNNRLNLLVGSSSGFSSLPRNYVFAKGSSFETKKDACRKSDDEGEPRSPTDICSSDDDKKPFHSQPHQTSREESLEEEPSEEKPLGTGTTECEESQSPAEPVDVRVGDWEKRLSFHNDGYRRISPTIHESSEEEEEEELQSPEDSGEQAKTYLIEDAQGEILGRASPYDNGMANEKEIVTEDSVACPSESQPKAKSESIKVGVPVLRERSGSLPESNALQMSRNDSVTMSRNHSVTEKPTFHANEAVENEPANELRGLGFARVRSEGPGRTPRRTSSLKLLEANRSAEKSSSALDLRDIDEETSTVFNDSEVTSFVDHSAIQKTVRKVSRAFSGSSTPTEKSPPSEAQMRSAQTRYLVESRASEVSPTDKDMSVSSSDSSQHSLEEMLASIDRDLEDTRRTITCAQLLESALLIKNEGKPLAGQPTDSLRRRGRPRIIDFSVNDKDGPETNSPNVKNTNSPVFKRANGGEDRVDYSSVESQKPRRRIADFSGNTRIVEEKLSRSHEQDLRAEVKSRADAEPSRASHAEEKVDTRVRSNSQSKRRVFELFADGNHDEREHLGDQENEASTEAKTPENSKLPSVYQMARQYSQKVTDKKTVDNVRMRIRSTVRERTGSETLCSDEDTTDHTPKITIERVKKVSINNTPIEAYKLVRRRKRRSGSSRHRSDDVRRSSWSVEKVKPDSESPQKERPKSVYDMEALEATLTENLEQIEEGREPMLIDGLERDDVVVRGLVQHLVGKFNSQRSNAAS